MFTIKIKFFLLQLSLLTVCSQTVLACHGKLIATGITDDEREMILKEHNRLRQTVATGHYPGQPGAENMREIIWDGELALRAQQWAENCQFRHDPHRTINRFTMGQNLAIIWSTAPLDPDDGDFPSRIKSWFNEVQKYSFGDAWSPKTGHYSQLVWGETSLVGCGFSEYKDTSKYNKLYVCNYGPGGNVVGYKPYEVGRPSCASYGMKPSSRYHGLCSAPDGSTTFNTNGIETYEYTNANSKKATSTSFKIQQVLQQASTSKKVSTYGDFSFGDSHAITTETSQQQHSKYQNKLEDYNSSPEEFKKSVFKHTVLRTSLAQKQQETATITAKRGWSLLTWRG